MKPNFALSLSQESIRLLHASAGGWQDMGDVDPASDTLRDDLAVLRRTATALEPVGMRCALIIPESQIRYMQIDTPGLDATARQKAARASLNGATPYKVDDLSIDFVENGNTTHIAAVARETLAEAETFGREHGFNPVSFIAQPDAATYPGQPFFGLTALGEDLSQRDAVPQAPPVPGQVQKPPTEKSDTAPVDFISVRRTQTFSDSFVPVATSKDSASPQTSTAGFAEVQEGYQPATPPPATSAPGSQKRATEPYLLTPAQPQSILRKIALPTAATVLAGAVIWASGVFGNVGLGVLFEWGPGDAPASQFAEPLEPIAPAPSLDPLANSPVSSDAAALDHADVDAALLEALNAPLATEPGAQIPRALNGQDAQYAVTGIWTTPPDVPSPPAMVDLEDLYVTSIDPVQTKLDAVALPAVASQSTDLNFEALSPPAPAGTLFSLDERGLVAPSSEGTLSQDGVMIFAGKPPATPPRERAQTQQADPNSAIREQLSKVRPRLRPVDLSETTERATFAGLSRSELGEFRPRLRPGVSQETPSTSASLVPLDETSGSSLLRETAPEPTESVVSLRPEKRPANFALTVARIQQTAPAPVVEASVAPRVVTPSIPSSASATREATQENAINLRRVNLIGVYGKPSDRRALVRLENGRYQKVEVGDRLDGGQISAIGDSELRYQKRGRSIVLKMPQG